MLPGYWQQTLPLGPDPDGEGELVATLVRRGDGGRRPARRAGAARLHRLLLQHRAGRPLRRPRVRLLRAGPAQVRAIAAAGPDAALHHRPGRLRRRAGPRAGDRRAPTPAGATVCMYGHSAGGLIVTLWLDRLRERGAAASNIGGLVLNSPFFDLHGPAILRTAPTSAALIALARLRKLHVDPQADARAATAPACTATTPASSTTTSTGSRSAAFPSRSAGSTRSAAGRPGCTAASTSVCPT